MIKTSQKPTLRFEGFTDDWEQRKLGELFEEYHEKNHEELPALMIVQGRGTIRRDESTRNLVYDRGNLANYKMVNRGDFIVHLRSFEGGLELATDAGLISPAYHTFHGEKMDSRFYYSYFRSKKFIDTDLKPHVYGIRDGRSIDINGMKTILVPYTNSIEQQTIGKFIEYINNLITLHQRKYDKLVNIRKSMLDKMFPQKEAKVPGIRFEGFNDDWEQRNAKEVCSITTGKSNTQDQVDDGMYPFYIRSDIPVKSNKFLYDCEAVITIGDGNIGRVFHYVNGKFDLHQRCYKMADFKNLKGKYFYYFFSAKFYDRAMKMTAKGTVDSVRLDMISDMPIKYPSNTEEQDKISDLLSGIDNLITLYQCKLEKLQNIKKSCLEKMFV